MNISTRQVACIGPKNQKKLQVVSIAIIGVGALGSAAAHLLVRMGVGRLILCDNDVVADHNLGRQHLYLQEDIGKPKALTLAMRLKQIRSDIEIIVNSVRITEKNISLCDEASLILDGTDNHETRRVIDAYAKLRGISWVHGASIEDKGTVIYFPPSLAYDDVYAGKTKDQHCSISGVLMTATTAIATQQVSLAIKAIMGEEIPKVMYHLNGLEWTSINL